MLAVPRAAGAPCSRAGGARRIRGRGGSRRRMNAKLALLFGAGLLFPAAQPGASIYRVRARPALPRRFLVARRLAAHAEGRDRERAGDARLRRLEPERSGDVPGHTGHGDELDPGGEAAADSTSTSTARTVQAQRAGWKRMLGVAPKADGSFSAFVKPEWKGKRYRALVAGPNIGTTFAPDAQAIAAG